MNTFFSFDNAEDDEYRTLKASDWPPAVEARHFIEAIWSETAAYLDKGFRRKAARRFHPHFWELYLVAAVRSAGLPLLTRRERGSSEEGPDLVLETGLAIEAVTPMPGAGPDGTCQ